MVASFFARTGCTVGVRSIVYIDGFNLYYGAIRGGQYKWLDLERYFKLLRPGDDIQRISYFTALVNGPHRSNQESYLRALSTLPLVEISLGLFKEKQIRCYVHACTFNGRREFKSPEEKRTDVNIALQMLDDAYQHACERMIVVSGDSDLVPALNMVKLRFPNIQITVYVPSRNAVRGAAVELRSAADKDRNLPLGLLRHAQFPAVVLDGGGGAIHKPASW